MRRFIKKSKHEIGLSPQELVFRGAKKMDAIEISLIDFDETKVEEKSIDSVDKLLPCIESKSVSWININGLHDIDLLREIGEKFELNNLLLADILETDSRPKIHEYDDYIYVSIKMLAQSQTGHTFASNNLSLVFNDKVLFSFQETEEDIFDPVRNRIRHMKRTLRRSKPDYLAFAILDTVIDHYLYNLSLFGEQLESFDEGLLDEQNKTVLETINQYKKELNAIRKSVKPAKEMILSLSKLESDFIEKKNDIHFKDLVNNINQASDTTDGFRELLSDQLNIYHMMISSKLNDIIKFLTIFSVLFIPLTFIAGIYGTNFDVLPELHYKYGYYIMLGIMAVIAAAMLFYFKRKKWL